MEQKGMLLRFLAEAEERGVPLDNKKAVSEFLRARMLKEFHGSVPTSLMWFDKSLDTEDPTGKGRNTVGYTEGRPTDMYGAQKDARRMSIFEGRLAEFCLRFWSDPGDLVLDPFAGRITRMTKAVENDRRYLGFDTSMDAVELNEAKKKEQGWTDEQATLVHNSLLVYPKKLEPVDFVFTCPPYWNSEFYGDNGLGVEGTSSYGDFLEEVVAILALAEAALKQEGYLVLVVKDFFLHRQMVSFHSDLTRAMTALGLVQWDCVAKKMSTLREMFHRDIIQHRRTAQTHEYVLVFQKNSAHRSKDVYRVHCHQSNKARQEREWELALRRREVLESRGLDLRYLRPSLQLDSM